MNETGFKTGPIVARFSESDKHAARMALHCAIEGFAYLTLSAKYMRRVPAYRDHFSRWAGIIENKIICHLPYILNKRITSLARNCGWEPHNKPFHSDRKSRSLFK